MAAGVQTTISPVDGKPVVERKLPSDAEIDQMLERAQTAYRSWRKTPLSSRLDIIKRFISAFEADGASIAASLTPQMGRPTRYVKGEVGGFLERARYLVSIAERELADVELVDTDKEGFQRVMRKEPLGVCLLLSAWNFPFMIQVNALIPALLAGNAVILKPSPQTPLTSEVLAQLLTSSGLPQDVVQVLHTTPESLDRVVSSPLVNFVSFTGSVDNGARVDKVARGEDGKGFKQVMLELGGKDPAYVREDADPEWSAAEIADGAFFNSGQSCCAVERVYVHEKAYDRFVKALVDVAKGYVLGDPNSPDTTLGPVISTRSAALIRSHVADAVAKGAKALVPSEPFAKWDQEGTTYVAPQVVVDADHSMKIMTDETFGPVVAVAKVKSDAEALKLMNDSIFGLTASVWTKDEKAFDNLLPDIEAGTVFLNRCDYLDPALAWTGVKQSGRGISLSKFGFDAVTHVKSVHRKRGPKGVQGQ